MGDGLLWPALTGVWLTVLLFLHHHHLHTFTYPRHDSYVLLVLELMLCSRRFVMQLLARVQTAATKAGLHAGVAPFAAAIASCSYAVSWAYFSSRPHADVMLLLVAGIPMCCTFLQHGLDSSQVSLDKASSANQAVTILVTSFENAVYVGALPCALSLSESILHEPAESARITCVALLNSIILGLLELVNDSRWLKWRASPTECTAGPWGWLAWASDPTHADQLRLGMIGAQGLLVCVLLGGFLYSYHWRSHTATLMSNYVLLYACVAVRKRRHGAGASFESR
jgi:hypothetical protein